VFCAALPHAEIKTITVMAIIPVRMIVKTGGSITDHRALLLNAAVCGEGIKLVGGARKEQVP
jgi:hypothetical protein